jgi:hypothetical protein
VCNSNLLLHLLPVPVPTHVRTPNPVLVLLLMAGIIVLSCEMGENYKMKTGWCVLGSAVLYDALIIFVYHVYFIYIYTCVYECETDEPPMCFLLHRYSIRDTVPKELWTYLTGSVKKSSGIVKRFLRVSEIYLYDFRDWATFRKKAKQITIDYIMKTVLAAVGMGSKS